MKCDYYYIVKNRQDYLEVVHPKQIRRTDRTLLTVSKDDWHGYCLWCGQRGFPLLTYSNEKEFLEKYDEYITDFEQAMEE